MIKQNTKFNMNEMTIHSILALIMQKLPIEFVHTAFRICILISL